MEKQKLSELSPLKPAVGPIQLFIKSMGELLKSQNDLFFLFGVALLTTLGLSSLTSGLSLYLISVQELSDLTTGYIIATFGASSFFYSLLLGGLIDKYGLKYSMIFGNFAMLLGLTLIIFLRNPIIQVAIVLTLVSGGSCVVYPSLKLGIKHYANEYSKSLGYSFLYIIFFIAGALSGLIIDLSITFNGNNQFTFQLIFSFGAGLLLISTCLSYYITNVTNVNENLNNLEITLEVMETAKFWRFMVLTLLLVIIKALYAHLTVTLPIYMNREIENNAHFGYMLMLHKGIMVIFIPVLTTLVFYYKSYTLLIIGGAISACSVIPLLVTASYLTVSLFIVFVSIGESLYAPRLIDYTLQIAPKGKEGTFVALASSSLSLSMIVSGISGGVLLNEYCPEEGEQHCWAMWGIIGIISISSPIFMLLFRSVLEEPEKKEEVEMEI